MMRTAVCPVDHRIGRARQLVVESPRDKPSDHGGWLGLTCQHKTRCRAFPAVLREATMDALDDVAAFTERSQRRLGIFPENPLTHTDLVCKPKPFQLPHAPD